jgi:hypothetical protein
MSENKTKVTDWIRSGMDYNEGIKLLIEITRKQFWFDLLTGREKTKSGKLAYELCKASQLADMTSWKDVIENIKSSKVKMQEKNVPGLKLGKLPKIKNGEENHQKVFYPIPPKTKVELHIPSELDKIDSKPVDEYPPVIRRIIHEYAELFQERSKLHAVMTEMPEVNTDEVVAKRSELFDIVKSISARLEFLFSAKNKFDENGTIPDEKEIFPEPKKEEPLDLNLLDEPSLKKMKKNLQSNNSKDQALLDYQSKDHGKEKKPMPEGPKRTKLEFRIAERNKKIQEIESLLLKYVVKQ